MQAELIEIHDAIGKISATTKRTAQREVMRERRAGAALPEDPAQAPDKATLRKMLGLRAGEPAPHR